MSSKKKETGLINSKREPITPDKLRELSGLTLSDEQAEETIRSLDQLAQILFEITGRNEQLVQDKPDC